MASKKKHEEVDPVTLRGSALTFSLRRRSVSLDDFERFVHETRATLENVSRAAESKTGDWILTDLQFGSATMAFAPAPSLLNRRGVVENAVIDGFRAVESASSKPSYFPERALSAIRRLSVLADDGTIDVSTPDGRVATLSSAAGKNVEMLLRPARRYFGSVIGSLDVLSVHRNPYITVYGDHGDVIRCYMMPELIDEAKELLGRRVIVTGTIATNRLGNMVSIKGDSLYEAPRRNNRPPNESAGSIPDFTGGLEIEAFLSELRGDVIIGR